MHRAGCLQQHVIDKVTSYGKSICVITLQNTIACMRRLIFLGFENRRITFIKLKQVKLVFVAN